MGESVEGKIQDTLNKALALTRSIRRLVAEAGLYLSSN
jgi:hypothetical protein